ncbi:MAG TPA: M20/M25/M40 family metallo-hydrolase [Gemmatimonadales bacterium]|nr:M20/M25/M40 family metallo-hydrolase [Gemmatimonadales bacterium]
MNGRGRGTGDGGRVALCLLAALAAGPLPAQTDRVEQRMVRAVDARRDSAVALLERAVNLNSGTLNLAGVRAVGDLFQSELDALGFTTRWVDGAEFERAGHLVAVRGTQGPRILLIGHLDTVFEQDSPFQRFERLDDSTARGPGVVDMKGGNVVILEALRALRAAGVLDRLSLQVVLTGDEERSGRPLTAARAALVAAAAWADVAIGFENADNDPRRAVVARRGSTAWELRVTGRPSHSSQIFREEVGAGAVFEAARILHRFYDELSTEPNLSFNPGAIVGGTEVVWDNAQARGTAFGKNNVVAAHAVVTGDLRALSPEQLAAAKTNMLAIAADHLPHTTAELTFIDSYPPLAPTEGNRRLLAQLDRVSRDLGFGPVTAVEPRNAGAADVSFTAGLVDAVVDGLGTKGADEHTARESIDLRSLPLQSKRAAVLLYRLSRGTATP